MLRLMIVDDEYLFREALKISLPWDQLGYEVCCEAENGYDALEKIAEFNPDIALVDINMPVMDGLELAAEIKEKGYDIKVIIITGYGEFTYARQAIEVGVGNYLLKPIEENELIKALALIKLSVEKERTARLEKEALVQQVNDYKPILKELFLHDMIQGNRFLRKDEYSIYRNFIEVDLDSSYCQVAVIELDEKTEYRWDSDTRQMWFFAVSNIAGELLKDYCPYEFCRDIQGRLAIVLFLCSMEEDHQIQLLNVFERIRLSVAKSLGITITVGIGKRYEQINQLSMSCKEALYAVKNKRVIGENSVIPYAVISEYKLTMNFFPIEQKMQLHISLRIGDISEAERIIGTVFQGIRLNNPSIEMARLACIELCSSLVEVAVEAGCNIQSILDPGFNLLDEAQNKKGLDDLEVWIWGVFTQISAYFHGGKSKRPSRIVEDAKKYIDENYTRFDLKIDEIAKKVYVKYGHLCFLFKRETGKTINEYISDLRIYKAKELIDGGCSSISLVAAKVGYADANYFSKCFKKLVGITPGSYILNYMSHKA